MHIYIYIDKTYMTTPKAPASMMSELAKPPLRTARRGWPVAPGRSDFGTWSLACSNLWRGRETLFLMSLRTAATCVRLPHILWFRV